MEEDQILRELKIAKQNIRIEQSEKARLTRRKRVHRLCNHGGLLEYYLPPDEYTDKQIASILQILFHKPETKEILDVFCKHFLEKVADKNGECCISKTEIVAGTFQTEDFRLLKHAGIHR